MMKMLAFRPLFCMSKVKIPSIEDVRKEWNDYSLQYNTFDVGPQTLYFSLANILQLRKASNILEVACGTGKLLPYALEVKNPNAHYLASDLSPNMVHLAKENLKAHFQKYQSRLTFEEWCSAQKIQFEVINAEEPFQHELFDRIICNCALMITQDPLKMLRNLNERSKAGCLFGLSVWGSKTQNNFFSAIRESILDHGFQLPPERSNFHLYKQVEQFAETAGWEVLLNWEQNALFPVLHYPPEQQNGLFNHQVNKLPPHMQAKVKTTLDQKLRSIFASKQGMNFACELYVLRKK